MPTNDPPALDAGNEEGEQDKSFTFIIEHLDPELGPWSALEYRTIARECHQSHNRFVLSSVSDELIGGGSEGLRGMRDVVAEPGRVERAGVEELFPGAAGDGKEIGGRSGVCLLDPQAERELSPEDGEVFEGFLFGGILGMDFAFFSSSKRGMWLRSWKRLADGF